MSDLKFSTSNLVNLAPRYPEEDGVICFEVITSGCTGPEWETRFDRNGYNLSRWSREILNHTDFVALPAGQVIEVTVLKGDLFNDTDRNTENIRNEASKRNLKKPNSELACLIREKFSNAELKEMGLSSIITMHEPIVDSDGGLILMAAHKLGDDLWLDAYDGNLSDMWYPGSGFAFVYSQDYA
jgi:hypothetical protein